MQSVTMYSSTICTLLLLLLWPLVYGIPTNRVRYCGTMLADQIRYACAGRGYADPYATTHASDDGVASNMNQVRRRNSPGIVTECCKIGCTILTLQSYCSGGVAYGISPNSNAQESSEENDIVADRSVNNEDDNNQDTISKMNFDDRIRKVSLYEIGTVSPEYLTRPIVLPRPHRPTIVN